jgi:hypothetical protein
MLVRCSSGRDRYHYITTRLLVLIVVALVIVSDTLRFDPQTLYALLRFDVAETVMTVTTGLAEVSDVFGLRGFGAHLSSSSMFCSRVSASDGSLGHPLATTPCHIRSASSS